LEGPGKLTKAAFQCVVDLLEFHCPKLARQEHAGAEENAPIIVSWKS
jgi:hypothetical protein